MDSFVEKKKTTKKDVTRTTTATATTAITTNNSNDNNNKSNVAKLAATGPAVLEAATTQLSENAVIEPIDSRLLAGSPIDDCDEFDAHTFIRDDEERHDEELPPSDVRVGAIWVNGPNIPQGLRQQQQQDSSLFINAEEKQEEEESPNNNGGNKTNVVAEVVDDSHLYQEFLSRLQHDVVQAENVSTILDPSHDVEKKTKRQRVIQVLAIAVVIVIAAVVTSVLVTRYKKQSNPNSLAPPPALIRATTQPSAAPTAFTRFKAFRSLLLDHTVSSSQSLDDPTSPQHQALSWLANADQAMLYTTTSISIIIDRYVLAVIYFSTNGKGWDVQCNFLKPSDICAWQDAPYVLCGVICPNRASSNETVSRPAALLLGSNDLAGTIPTELGMLTSLTELELYNNPLDGTIPTELIMLTSLTVLNFGVTYLTGTVPTLLGMLTSLEVLDLSVNSLAGSIPTELGALTSLTELYLHKDSISGTIPTELGNLTSLTQLNLAGNSLTGSIPTELGMLTSLSYLGLHSNNSLVGNLTAIFCPTSKVYDYFAADCNETSNECTCCTECS